MISFKVFEFFVFDFNSSWITCQLRNLNSISPVFGDRISVALYYSFLFRLYILHELKPILASCYSGYDVSRTYVIKQNYILWFSLPEK